MFITQNVYKFCIRDSGSDILVHAVILDDMTHVWNAKQMLQYYCEVNPRIRAMSRAFIT